MNLYFPPFIYLFFLMLGTIISISSSSVFGMWMGLEINLMSFIPLVINLENNKKSSEAAIKYFLIQAIASAMVIFSALTFFIYSGNFLSPKFNLVISLALMTKLGMAPFHFWFPEVIEGLNWMNSLILLTWQKISPLVILSLFFHPNMLLLTAMISAVMGAISGFNQTSLRKILAFSSISHLGWMSSLMFINSSLWMNYFLIYFITSIILCVSFWTFNLNYFSQLTMIQDLKKKIIIFINLLSLGGLPPLLGFLPKWTAMFVLSKNVPILTILIASSLVTLYFYTRICFSTFTLYFQNILWMFKLKAEKNNYILSFMTFISISGIFPLIFASI
uniref:NADH-ubiquinone oxidoreductase chain 2 n=1 Tax=Octomeris sp. BKKC-2014 TaxID=1527578 RepID=A0A0U1WQY0_9CRUS|nr:NADH dehydrogenase subunit 2 [Octomeris sp. BKKC-2014]